MNRPCSAMTRATSPSMEQALQHCRDQLSCPVRTASKLDALVRTRIGAEAAMAGS